ncbi:TlpA family protein disulfide reductase [Aerococcaceae bacterium zg-ZUI334]|uniref:TlpA family protein disulfide reductase n=1 Tax=Aerococcaceae bacterium zg-252 TaxID=2796928 RepID=UPI001B9BB339|nr:TlpA family protein disulfide reductase [Aerococcaceae bacterium zg-ZUI334]MBS4462646.1 TlpA family protein disulfide reductase [Aerococcaceae bacterium zg-B36]
MKKLLTYLLGFILLFTITSIFYQRASKTEIKLPESIVSSETTLTEIGETTTETIETTVAKIIGPDTTFLDEKGNIQHLNDKKGRPMVLNLWASWCPPCREEMPFFANAYQTYQHDVEFIMLNAIGSRDTETKEVADSFLAEMGLDLPIYYDIDKNNQFLFGATIFPSTVFFDETGRAVKTIRGMITEEQLFEEINALLGQS